MPAGCRDVPDWTGGVGAAGVHNGTAWCDSISYRSRMQCGYCARDSTARIPSIAGDVCQTHAIAFWTGLLAYSRQQRRAQRKRERLFERLQALTDAGRGHASDAAGTQ